VENVEQYFGLSKEKEESRYHQITFTKEKKAHQ
jgi:hypothetical protein